MIRIWNCRRSSLALISIICLTGVAIYLEDLSGIPMAITGIVTAVAGSNAYQKTRESKNELSEG